MEFPYNVMCYINTNLSWFSFKIQGNHSIIIDAIYLTVPSVAPASQWYRAGTVFHCFARATIAPASKTPNPNRWLNSRPTPFMVQWNRPLESNKEFLFEVKTVRCCMSRQVSFRLKREILLVHLFNFFIFFTSMAIMNSTCTKACWAIMANYLLRIKCQCKYSSGFWCCSWGSGMCSCTFAV